MALAKQHAGFAINNIVKEVLHDMNYESNELYRIDKSSNDEISDITFDSKKLNALLHAALKTIDDALLAAQDGLEDPITKNVFYEEGIVYQVPLGYLTHIYFLYDKGPLLDVRMRLLNDVTGEIVTSIEPYGLNSAMIKISLLVRVNAQVITLISSSAIEKTCEIPLVLQVVNGKVPSYGPYAIKGN